MPDAGLRIAVTVCQDGRMFAGNVEVTVGKPPIMSKRWNAPPPWALSEETALGLGLATTKVFTIIGRDKAGTANCRCKVGLRAWPPPTCTRAERQGKPCMTNTSVWREDRHIRLHRCKICRGFFIAHYTAHLCSDACVRANRQAWLAEHRRPAAPSKAAQRRAALATARCQVCGSPFKPLRLSARFCSNRCRQSHYRNARKAA